MPKGKKSSDKAKIKKQLNKQLIEQERATKELVKKAKEEKDMLEHFKPFRVFKKQSTGMDATIEYRHAADLSPDLRNWIFALTKANMEALYNACRDWGWNDKIKRQELEDEDGRYIIAKDTTTQEPLGFIHIRFMYQGDLLVCYVWEIQLAPDARRKGLGTFLMQLTELISWKFNFEKVILTVFKDNVEANSFYKDKLKYAIDETDPSVLDPAGDDCGYEILSKARKVPPKPADTDSKES